LGLLCLLSQNYSWTIFASEIESESEK